MQKNTHKKIHTKNTHKKIHTEKYTRKNTHKHIHTKSYTQKNTHKNYTQKNTQKYTHKKIHTKNDYLKLLPQIIISNYYLKLEFFIYYSWIISSGRIYKVIGSAETLSRSHGYPEIYN